MEDIIFSPWIAWSKRKSFEKGNSSGVYLLAHFETVPEGPADPQSIEIIYIGETTKGSISKRWREGRKKLLDISKDNLYVAAFLVNNIELKEKVENDVDEFFKQRQKNGRRNPTIVDRKHLVKEELKKRDMLTQTFIKYVERKLIWEYVRRWGKRPDYNKE